ncbi:MAG: transglycosylase SLT domain-containing protein [Gammaproteobacteria bacterium]|nr:transglycosylase SLT domain-containing protein [Gammaproteobacteria bacterium]
MSRPRNLITILCLALLCHSAQADIENQRQVFQQASRALELRQVNKFKRLLGQIEDYPARPYLIYDALKQNINRASNEKISKFLNRYQDFPFSYHLRARWLSILAKRQDWQNYLVFFDNRDSARLQCLSFQARLKLGKTADINQDIKKLWLRGYSQPDECDVAFDHFLDTYDEVKEAIWLRIEKAFQARRPSLARYLGKKLSESDQEIVNLWYRAHRRPEQTLVQLTKLDDEPINRTVIVHAIDRLARRDSLKARDIWQGITHNFQFSPEQRDRLAQRIALSAAYQHQPEAQKLLMDLRSELKNDKAYLWLARIQLRNRDWQELSKTISGMPKHLQQENEWQYWLARALKLQGFITGSDDILVELAKRSSYYGFLAADRINMAYHIEQESVAVADFDQTALLKNNPHMLRARELFFLHRFVDAKREWFQAVRKLNTVQLKQAATMASSWKWHDSAIKTVARTSHRRDYSLRFPMPYKKQVMNNASRRELDPSVIYGVMRRESLFDPLARSKVGALGLMQLMPSTAKRVAKLLGLKNLKVADILKVENNIKLGTHYFRSVMNRFDNNVSLAAAAYNAGPLNVKKWLPRDDVLPADLWVETVPFNETRNYVQAVLAYATVFDKTLGKDTLISSRMHDVRMEY